MTAWPHHDIPHQTGRTAIVTGNNTGIGNSEKGTAALDLADLDAVAAFAAAFPSAHGRLDAAGGLRR